MKIISIFALFAILVSAVPAFSIDISHSLSSRGALVISRLEGFDFKTQGSNSLELATLLEWSSWAISGILGIHGTGATNLEGGWGYRGYEGVHARIQVEIPFLSYRATSGNPPCRELLTDGTLSRDTRGDDPTRREEFTPRSALRAGWGGGGGAFFSRYRETDLLFFYPSAYAFLYLDYSTAYPRVRLRYSVPFEWYFRKDLVSSFSLGLSIGVVYTWTIPHTKEDR